MSAPSLEAARLVVPMPAGWVRMPEPSGADAAAWPERVVADAADEHRGAADRGVLDASAERLRRALEDALRSAAAQQDPRRLRWVLVGPPPVHSLQAWASLDLVARADPDAEQAALAFEAMARAERTEQPGVATWHREIGRRGVAGGPAVVVHDLLTVAASDLAAPAVQHRAVVVLFPAPPVVVTFEVSTPRLTAFADIEAAAVAIADGIRIEEAP